MSDDLGQLVILAMESTEIHIKQIREEVLEYVIKVEDDVARHEERVQWAADIAGNTAVQIGHLAGQVAALTGGKPSEILNGPDWMARDLELRRLRDTVESQQDEIEELKRLMNRMWQRMPEMKPPTTSDVVARMKQITARPE